MALKHNSLFLYGFEINTLNSSLDFRIAPSGPVIQATLNLGYYSLTAIGTEISRALHAADPTANYTVSIDRTVSSGQENRVTIASDGTHFDILFGSGPRIASSVGPLIGFLPADRTGMMSYTANLSAGTTLTPSKEGFNYLPPEFIKDVQGVSNISANGDKETVTFGATQYIMVEFKYEPELKVMNEWVALMDWMIVQRLFEFTPDVSDPTRFFEVTLEKTERNAKGMGYAFKEMLPDFPFLYSSGSMMFRIRTSQTTFI